VKVKGKGPVVVSGCAHSGIINTVRYLKKKAGTDDILAVIGGFHLTGQMFDPIISPTIEQMKAHRPTLVVPTHYTGWKAIGQFASEMPGQFVLNTVGTAYSFQ
jgi:7,8-dihydropterin-6-yl-methyl-4-(beta-D-ribofuranosyl)aminobenzene 5'-phosphate synthase